MKKIRMENKDEGFVITALREMYIIFIPKKEFNYMK